MGNISSRFFSTPRVASTSHLVEPLVSTFVNTYWFKNLFLKEILPFFFIQLDFLLKLVLYYTKCIKTCKNGNNMPKQKQNKKAENTYKTKKVAQLKKLVQVCLQRFRLLPFLAVRLLTLLPGSSPVATLMSW